MIFGLTKLLAEKKPYKNFEIIIIPTLTVLKLQLRANVIRITLMQLAFRILTEVLESLGKVM